MILDKELSNSIDQNLAGAAATTVSTNTIDLLDAVNDQGIGHPVRALVNVTEAFAGGTSVKADLIESANANLSAPTVLVAGVAVVTAQAIAGKRLLDVRIPNTTKRYLGFQYTTVGVHTTGKIDAQLLVDVPHPRYLPTNTGR
ncbi:MAG: Bbp16 family capsid cement protein [Casimicrobium sp.]